MSARQARFMRALGENAQLRSVLRLVLEADELDRRMGYPLNGTSALHAALVYAEETMVRLNGDKPPEMPT